MNAITYMESRISNMKRSLYLPFHLSKPAAAVGNRPSWQEHTLYAVIV